MIRTSLLATFSLLFTGCCSLFCDKPLPCSNEKPYCATMDVSMFKHKDPMKYQYWAEKIDENTTFIVQKEGDFYNNVEDVILLKGEYNLLLNRIKEFNKNTEMQNQK